MQPEFYDITDLCSKHFLCLIVASCDNLILTYQIILIQ